MMKCFVPGTTQQIEMIRNLGLKSEWLQDIARKALAAYNQVTAHDAATAAGSYAYFAAIRELRDILCPKGWEPYMRMNVEMVFHPETNIWIMVSSGNKDTGNENGTPQTKNEKGKETKKWVSLNDKQICFPNMERKITNISLSHIWILLFHIDTLKSQMRMELSLPTKVDIDGSRVNTWNDRIIIDPIDFSHTPSPPKKHQDFVPDITIKLERKSNG